MQAYRKHLLQIIGIINLLFIILHLAFWRLFNWSEELQQLSLDNRVIMQILNIHVTYTIMVFGILCLAFTKQLLTTKLGRFCILVIAGFWLLRGIDGMCYWAIGLNQMTAISAFCITIGMLTLTCIPKRP